MSIRPSSRIRSEIALPSNTSYVVIGDTALAVIYAKKLYETFKDSGTMPQIYLLVSGSDQTTDVSIENINYIAQNNQTIKRSLASNLVHLVLSSNEPISTSLSTTNTIFDQYFNYYTGSGVLGDLITAYIIPTVGCWFTSDSKGRLENFVKASTIQKDLTTNEFNVMNNIASLFNLAKTSSVIATKPSIMTQTYLMVYHEKTKLERQIYRDMYVDLTNHNSVNIATHVTDIKITQTDSCLSTVSYSTITGSTPNIENACVLYMNNLYSYVKLMGLNNVEHKKILIPVFYRCVFSIPQVTPYVNLSNLDPTVYPLSFGDGVSTRLTFTCPDVAEPGESINQNVPTWDVICYTCDEDYADPSVGGTYSDTASGKTLLIVEAISLTNRRAYSWDSNNMAVTVDLNSNSVELGRYNKFLLIAANVYQAYTGVPPVLPIGPQSVCSEGICSDYWNLEHSSDRESPVISILRMFTSLYGGTSYPTPNTVNGQQCCG